MTTRCVETLSAVLSSLHVLASALHLFLFGSEFCVAAIPTPDCDSELTSLELLPRMAISSMVDLDSNVRDFDREWRGEHSR